jgi:mannose-1-phosphate guanylyltransferase
LSTAILLAGGMGTRMGDLARETPKTMLDVGGRSLLARHIDRLAAVGITDIVVATGHLGGRVEQLLDEEVSDAIGLRYSREESPLGTGGALRLAASRGLDPDETVVIVNGDLISEHDLSAHLDAARGSDWCIHVRMVDDARAFGVVDVRPDQTIEAFREKPDDIGPRLVNAGTYVTRGALLHALPDTVPLSLEYTVFPQAVAEGLVVTAFRDDARFEDVGSPEALARARAIAAVEATHG